MADRDEPRLSLAEWMVLCLISEQPTYGLALVELLSRDGRLGQVWWVAKAVVYRAIQRLDQLGLIRVTGEQRSSQGPARSLIEASPAGRQLAARWLTRPVEHTRDVRSELLVKLALLDRAGTDPHGLLDAQLAQLRPISAALAGRLQASAGFDFTLTLWRHEALSATIRFLETLTAQAS